MADRVLLAAVDGSDTAERWTALMTRLSIPVERTEISTDGAASGSALQAAQRSPAVIVIGSGAAAETICAVASVGDRLVSVPESDDAAMLVALGPRIGRPGLANYVSALAGGSASLINWAADHPADPLAPGARLGLDEVRYRKVMAELVDRPTEVAATNRVPWSQNDRATPVDALEDADEQVTKGEKAKHAVAAAGLMGLMMLAVHLFVWGSSRSERLLTFTLLVLAIGSVFVGAFFARRLYDFGVPRLTWRRDVLHLLLACCLSLIAGFAATCAVGAVEMFGDSSATVWTSNFGFVAFLAGFASLSGLPFAAVAVTGAIAITRLRPSGRQPFGFAAAGASIALGLATALLIQSPQELSSALQKAMARKGLLSAQTGLGGETAEADIRSSQTQLGLPVDGKPSRELLAAVEALPDRSEWTVAADGSGDGADLAAVLTRAANAVETGELGSQTVVLRPGTYAIRLPAPGPSDMGEPTEVLSIGSKISVRGEGPAEDVIIEVRGKLTGIRLDGSRMENLTVRQIDVSTQPLLHIDAFNGGSELKDVRLLARSTGYAVEITAGDDRPPVLSGGEVRNAEGPGIWIQGSRRMLTEEEEKAGTRAAGLPGPKAIIRGVTVRSHETAIVVSGEAAPLVEDNHLAGMRKGHGLYLIEKAGGAYRRNDLRDITNYAAIATSNEANVELIGNVVRRNSANCLSMDGSSEVFMADNDFAGCSTGNYYAINVSDLATLKLGSTPGLGKNDIGLEKRGKVVRGQARPRENEGASSPSGVVDYTE